MKNYYSRSLNSDRLVQCYDSAPPRIKQFLEEEIRFVLDKVKKGSSILDLGCGYGRVAIRLSDKDIKITGIDISEDNIRLAEDRCKDKKNMVFHVMNAADLKFEDKLFDLVLCVQNGISAFKVDPDRLLSEAARVAKKGGVLLFSSYSEKIWDARLEWFNIQAELGLIGEIDLEKTGNGKIVCTDGFTALTFSGKDFLEITSHLGLEAVIHEVDESSVFCEIMIK